MRLFYLHALGGRHDRIRGTYQQYYLLNRNPFMKTVINNYINDSTKQFIKWRNHIQLIDKIYSNINIVQKKR